MKNVDEMSIEEKISELQNCLSTARTGTENPGSSEYNYLLSAKLGEDKGETLSYYSVVVKNAATLLGRLDDLDLDVRQQTLADLNAKLDAALLSFPGYGRTENQSRGSK